MADPAVVLEQASLQAEDGSLVLGPIDWRVDAGQRWVVLGANGSGKTSLLRIAGAECRPTSGRACVLGNRLGRVDMRVLRARIGVASMAVEMQLRPGLLASDAVMTGRHAALEPWWHHYRDADRKRAAELLDFMGCATLGARPLGSLSQGERQRVLLARSLMCHPDLLLLDEPAAGLDLPGRELLVDRLQALTTDPSAPTMVLVTHHVEEIPGGISHALLLRRGCAIASGPIERALTPESMTAAFELPISVCRQDGRWQARRRPVGHQG